MLHSWGIYSASHYHCEFAYELSWGIQSVLPSAFSCDTAIPGILYILLSKPSDIGQRFQITAGRALAVVSRDGTKASGAHCSFGAWVHPVAGHPEGPTAAKINEADPQESFECLAYPLVI